MEPHLIQGSPEWLAWRRKGIGASDAGDIMGVGFRTPRDVWLEKIGLGIPIVETEAMREGKRLEPVAREWASKELGIELEPVVLRHNSISYMFASLDGYNEKHSVMVEIKIPRSGVLHEVIPHYYHPQLMHQGEVCEVAAHLYISHNGVTGKILEVKKDVDYTQKLLESEADFWHHVENFIEIEDLNQYIKRSDKEYQDQLRIYLHNKEHRELWENLEKESKDKLVEMSVKNSECLGYKISQRVRQGSIDVKKLSKEMNVDLTPYRREPSTYWEVRESKNGKA